MKRYTSLGELLVDYREYNKISQSNLAAEFDVDVRTIIRWEKNDTLLKPEKEEAMVDITFIPYQVVRNLNAPVSIPTFFDLSIRKYSLSSLSNDLPEAEWLKDKLSYSTERLRTIEYDSDMDNIIRATLMQEHISEAIDRDLLKKAINLLPELNLIMFDTSNYYSGHCVFLPLNEASYNKLRNREIQEKDLTVNDLVDYKYESRPIFFAYSINADCNENLFSLSAKIMTFFKAIKTDYLYGSFISRMDSYTLNSQMGIKIVWDDGEQELKHKVISSPRFYEGNFTEFLSK